MLATQELIREAALPRRLEEALPGWLRDVPLYQRPGSLPAGPATPFSLAELRRLPFITKLDIRTDFPRNFLRPNVELEDLLDRELVELEHTSGTSEERTPLLLAQGWWAEQEARALRLNPLVADVLDSVPAARRVTINSPVCSGDIRYTGTPSRADRIVGNALFVSLTRLPFLWGEADLARMAGEALEWQPQFLDVDPVYGALFALYCERQAIRLPSLRFIICSYEYVSQVHRRILERAFGVPVLNLYGSTETGHLLMEAEDGEMRPSFETAFMEVLAPDERGVGELAVTTLTNDYMPLIRYRIGDLVEWHHEPYHTTCQVHGRVADAFASSDGKRATTWDVDRCVAAVPGIAHYQLSERSPGDWWLRFAPDMAPPNAVQTQGLREQLGQLLGLPQGPAIQQVDLFMPEQSGKFRLGCPLKPKPLHA